MHRPDAAWTPALFEHFRDTKAFLFVEESSEGRRKKIISTIIKGRRLRVIARRFFPRELHTFKLNDRPCEEYMAPVIGFYTDQIWTIKENKRQLHYGFNRFNYLLLCVPYKPKGFSLSLKQRYEG